MAKRCKKGGLAKRFYETGKIGPGGLTCPCCADTKIKGKKKNKDTFRFLATVLATILTIASLSVLTKTTREFVRMDLRFGIYMTLIGGLVASLYSFLRYQEQKKREIQDIFHYPQEEGKTIKNENDATMNYNSQKMSPPPPSEPEQHTIFASASKK